MQYIKFGILCARAGEGDLSLRVLTFFTVMIFVTYSL